MTTQRVSQLAGMITGPTLGLPIITAATPPRITFGVALTYLFAATSDLTVTWSVVSGTLPAGVTLGTDGTFTTSASTPGGDFSFIAGATNTRGTRPVTVNCSVAYQAALDNVAVTGFKIGITLPVAGDTISTIQWYKNTGAGPVAVSGATSTAWTPTSSEVGALPSARGRTAAGVVFFTPEFTGTKQVMASTGPILWPAPNILSLVWSGGIVTATTDVPHGIYSRGSTGRVIGQTPSAYAGFFNCAYVSPTVFTYPLASNPGPATVLGTMQRQLITNEGNTFLLSAGITLSMPTAVRSIGSNGYYVDQILSAGTYTANDPILIAGLTGAPSNTPLASIVCQQRTIAGPPPILQAQTDSAAATATRPSGNTGTGFFVRYGALYDPNGNKFRIRGLNQCYIDDGVETKGFPKTKANTNRIGIYTQIGWATDPTGYPNKGLIDANTTNKIVSMPAVQYVHPIYHGYISGNTLTVTSMTNGNVIGLRNPYAQLSATTLGYYNAAPTGGTKFNVLPFGTGGTSGTGGVGTYMITGSAQTVGSAGSPVVITQNVFATGMDDGAVLDGLVQIYIDQAANWTTYNDRLIINLLNEWGPGADTFTATITGTSMNVTAAPLSTNQVYVGMSIDVPGNGTVKVTDLGTGIGGTGTYTIDTNLGSLGSLTMRNVTWREAYIRGIARLRTAGYLCLFCCDAGGHSGQDTTGFTNGDALAILNADTQHNVMFSLHQYGAHNLAGDGFAALLAPMYTAQQASIAGSAGLTFMVGEFANGLMVPPSPTLLNPVTAIGTAESFNFGWIPWAFDNPASGTGPLAIDMGFAMCQNAAVWSSGGGGYKTSDPNDLTDYGRQVILNPNFSTSVLAVPATIY